MHTVEATQYERTLAADLAKLGGLTREQVPGLALILAAYREKLVHGFEVVAEGLTADAEQSEPQAASAFIRAGDKLRTAIELVRGSA